MTQLPLILRPLPRLHSRIARRTDPASSQLAALEVTASGRRQAQAERVLAAVQRWPGRTSRELATMEEVASGAVDEGGLRYIFARRLPELERVGKVRKGPQRICTVGCRLAVTWEAA